MAGFVQESSGVQSGDEGSNPAPDAGPTINACDADAIDLRIAIFGPHDAGKTSTIRSLAASFGAGAENLVSIATHDRSTLLYDYLLVDLGDLGGTRFRIHVYSLPGKEEYSLAARMIVHSADGVILTLDGRDSRLAETLSGIKSLSIMLAEAGNDIRTFPLVVQINKIDLTMKEGGCALTERRAQALKAPIFKTTASEGHGVRDLLKTAVGLVLQKFAARPEGLPRWPRGLPAAPKTELRVNREADAANEIYLRTFSSTTTNYTPHSEAFLGAILEKFNLLTQEQLSESIETQDRALNESLDMTLAEIILKRGFVGNEDLRMGQKLKALSEVIHEQILYGKIAMERQLLPFDKLRDALLFQKTHHFQFCLGTLLQDTGAIGCEGHVAIMKDLRRLHQDELMHSKARGQGKTTARLIRGESKKRKTQMFFGSLAVKNKFISQKQLDEALRVQKELRSKGVNKYLGVVLQELGFVSQREVEIICSSLEKYLARNPIEGYKIEAQLGRGAMGLVYAAVQLKLDRIVALKILDPRYAMDYDYIQRFYKEAKIAATLNHPNIVHAFDVGESMGYHYFAMEYVQGVTMAHLLKERGKLEEADALRIIMQVVSALHHAEQHRLVHLDIKPANIMISDSGGVKLCDLGLAKTVDSASEFSDNLIVGSPFYISPEQIERNPDLDARSDIYSLGATLFHMLCGQPPYSGENTRDIFIKHLTNRIPNPADFTPNLSAALPPILRKMLEKNREDRFQNMDELWNSLSRLPSTNIEAATPDRPVAIGKRLSALLKRKGNE